MKRKTLCAALAACLAMSTGCAYWHDPNLVPVSLEPTQNWRFFHGPDCRKYPYSCPRCPYYNYPDHGEHPDGHACQSCQSAAVYAR